MIKQLVKLFMKVCVLLTKRLSIAITFQDLHTRETIISSYVVKYAKIDLIDFTMSLNEYIIVVLGCFPTTKPLISTCL